MNLRKRKTESHNRRNRKFLWGFLTAMQDVGEGKRGRSKSGVLRSLDTQKV